MKKYRIFLIQDIDCKLTVEVNSRKEVLSYLDEYLDNLPNEWFDGSDECFHILYKDGMIDSINEEYDGHKIRRQNIASIVYDNPCTSMVYGNFEVNEYGVVHPVFEESISDINIVEITI